MQAHRLDSLINSVLADFGIDASDTIVAGDDPVAFLETHMYIPETGQPITLHDEQRRVLREMFRLDERGNFVYSTMVYSSIKKSAKTTIGAGLALWQAYRVPHGEIYIVGNDLKQADNRMNQAIRYCVQTHPVMRRTVKETGSKFKFELPNGTRIEAVPVDPTGEAGPNPSGIFWTEVWGAKQKKHELMWSEMTLSPTRAGQSFRFVESYAGHRGESRILERLYDAVVDDDNVIDTELSPELYADGQTVVYWNTRRYLPWQTGSDADAYYAEEARTKTPGEYNRMHRNWWADSDEQFVDKATWESCRGTMPGQYRWVVLGVDAAVNRDCFAVVGVARESDKIFAPFTRVWRPHDNQPIDFDQPIKWIKRMCERERVLVVTYDPYQLHEPMARLKRELKTRVVPFNQGNDRLLADKQLRDFIVDGRIVHDGDAMLTEHVLNANADVSGKDENKLRLVKRSDDLKIDAAVALSMAAWWAMKLK